MDVVTGSAPGDTTTDAAADDAAWTAAIDRAVHEPDPVLANLLVTQAHHDLGLALRGCLGTEAGANFPAWATWGSRAAGTTIAMADLPWLRRVAPARPALRRARTHVAAGNLLVLDEIGRELARFVVRGGDHEPSVPALAPAFAAYRAARPAPGRTVDERRNAAYAGNVAAVWHEHLRLQPHISAAIPRGFRPLITRTLLDYRVGARRLHVGRDVAPGTAARDWASFGERMRYVGSLFAVHHDDPEVFASPYGPELTRQLRDLLSR